MAACAPDGDAHKGFANGVELVIHDVGENFVFIGIPVAPVPKCQPAGGDDGVWDDVPCLVAAGVAGELFGDECLPGHVGIEGIDDPVAVLIGLRKVALATDSACIL